MYIMSLADHVDEVHRKIGRNMMLFQEFEYLLKFIITNGSLSGPVGELELIRRERSTRVNKQTMGTLVTQYIENINSSFDSEDELDLCEYEDHASFSFRMYLSSTLNNYEAKKESLAKMVLDRNELVHHLLPVFDLTSVQSCTDVGARLDEQKEKILQENGELKTHIKAMMHMAEFLSSDAGEKAFELIFLQQSKLVALLSEFAIEKQRPDGWAVMDAARSHIQQQYPVELTRLKEIWGHKKLKDIVVASEIFDVFDEATSKDGTRVLYRLKSGV